MGNLSGIFVDWQGPERIYHSLSLSMTQDLDSLKTQLLKKFQCTDERFREKFRSVRPESEESFQSFHTRISQLYNRWIDLSGIDRSFDRLMDLMLQEQILQSCCKEMVVFLRERKCESVDELAEAGERYRIAHTGKSIARESVTGLWSGSDAASANECLANGSWRDNKSYRGNSRSGYWGSPYPVTRTSSSSQQT